MTETTGNGVERKCGRGLVDDVVDGFSVERFRKLVEESGLSQAKLSKLTGISAASIAQYSTGRTKPRYKAILALADFFAVPLDYLAGRMDWKTAEEIESDFGKRYMELRRKNYEDGILLSGHRNMVASFGKGIESPPYPYNLLECVIGEPWSEVFTEDQEDGLRFAMSDLSDREQDSLNLYFGEEKTLEETGKHFGISRERARQIIAKALRKLRYPRRMNYIRYGIKGNEEKIEAERRERRLTRAEEELDAWEDSLLRRRTVLEQLSDGLDSLHTQGSGFTKSVYDTDLEDMDLSVRSCHCLKRAGVGTLRDIVDLAKSGNMLRVRNFGRRSMQEVLARVRDLCGEDYTSLYV